MVNFQGDFNTFIAKVSITTEEKKEINKNVSIQVPIELQHPKLKNLAAEILQDLSGQLAHGYEEGFLPSIYVVSYDKESGKVEYLYKGKSIILMKLKRKKKRK